MYYKIAFNRSKKTYTIRVYLRGRIWRKYRTYPQGKRYSEHWTQNDIQSFLHNADSEYYCVKDYMIN